MVQNLAIYTLKVESTCSCKWPGFELSLSLIYSLVSNCIRLSIKSVEILTRKALELQMK